MLSHYQLVDFEIIAHDFEQKRQQEKIKQHVLSLFCAYQVPNVIPLTTT